MFGAKEQLARRTLSSSTCTYNIFFSNKDNIENKATTVTSIRAFEPKYRGRFNMNTRQIYVCGCI